MPLSYPAKVNDLDVLALKFDPNAALCRLLATMVKEVLMTGWCQDAQDEQMTARVMSVNARQLLKPQLWPACIAPDGNGRLAQLAIRSEHRRSRVLLAAMRVGAIATCPAAFDAVETAVAASRTGSPRRWCI